MARSEARIMVGIWADKEFTAMSPGAQRVYMFLISQPDIAHDGVLPLRERRWATSAAGLTPAAVVDCLRELAAARFIAIDQTTEELLVRSFIRRDGVYRQPNLLTAAKKHLALVTSPSIRAVLATELRRILTLPDVPKRSAEVIDEMLAELPIEPFVEPFDEANSNPSAKGSTKPTAEGTAISREGIGVVKSVTTGSPYPLDPLPLPLPPTAGTALPRVPPPVIDDESQPATTNALVAEWLEGCRKRPPSPVIGQIGKQIKAMLGDGIDVTDVRAGLLAWSLKAVHPSVLPSIVNEVMNGTPAMARGAPNGHRPFRNPTDPHAYEGEL